MKKITTFPIIIFLYVFMFLGCNNQSNNEINTTNSEKNLVEKEINCNCLDNCWSGKKELKRIKLKGNFPLKSKEDVQFFINQYNNKLTIEKLEECKVLKGQNCWSFSFNHPDSYLENGVAYGGCNYEGEIDIETGDIDEGGTWGSERTIP
jgi:hypothetical protein